MSSGHPVQFIAHNTAATNINTNAWVELDAALDGHSSEVIIYNATSSTIKLGVGPSGGEKETNFAIPPCSVPTLLPLVLPTGARLTARAVTANASSGFLVLTFLR